MRSTHGGLDRREGVHDDARIPIGTTRRLVRDGAVVPGAFGLVLWAVLGNAAMLMVALFVVVAFAIIDWWLPRNQEAATLGAALVSALIVVGLLPVYGGFHGPMLLTGAPPGDRGRGGPCSPCAWPSCCSGTAWSAGRPTSPSTGTTRSAC